MHAQNQTRKDSSGGELLAFTLFLRLHLHRLADSPHQLDKPVLRLCFGKGDRAARRKF